ncbi:transcription termination factor NusA [Psittacicella melopsittaci]|uniref:Transcription termination/antitermination protein NusA n=1 Tax=Psittacicella melopsittaci TaxID=2028576 RepID=A0A3A1YA32_9GAMM|nr:transcription termination factor NusA [Psittacicella melopsittaci]RIY33004.1 transcription termination factor NusA [Psittacicella melopsittaci]
MSDNKELELIKWAKTIAENRDISFEKILEAIEEGLAISVRRKYDGERAFRIQLDPETGKATVYRLWKVVEDVNVPTREISLEAALFENPNIKVGDYIEDIDEDEEITLDRIGYNTFRQIMTTKVRSLENEKIISSYEKYLGRIVRGRVRQSKGNTVVLSFPELKTTYESRNPLFVGEDNEPNYVEGILRRDGLIPGEKFRNNQEVSALLVALESGDPNKQQMVLSRTSPDFLHQLLRREVPEIVNGIIDVVDIVREPGLRAKVVVRSADKRLDIIGACVGIRSTRINPISRELRNEKIDIIPFDRDFVTYVRNVLSLDPSIEAQIIIDDKAKMISVAVEKEYLATTIGQKGVNVRLANQILDWKIHVYDIETFAKEKEEEDLKYIEAFEKALDINAETARFLIEQGFKHIEELAAASEEELEEFFEKEDAQLLKNLASAAVADLLNQQQQQIEEANLDPRLKDLEHMNNDILIQLIAHDIRTLEDLADLATDELTSYINMSETVANSLIMQARQIVWFNEEETEA